MRLHTAVLLFLLALPLHAQDDEDVRRFSIDAHIGGLHAGKGSTTMNGEKASDYEYGGKTPTGENSKFHLEYYLPRSEWSLKAGYESERINFLGGEAEVNLKQMMLGTRCYPEAIQFWAIQPYLGADALWNVGQHHVDRQMESHHGEFGNYHRNITGTLPKLSLAPVVGFDLKLFSSIDLTAEYSYRWGINSRLNVDSKYQRDAHPFQTRLHPHRGVFSIGLKITFPFHWRSSDSTNLFDGIFELIDGSLDEKYDRRMREQRDAKQYERTKSWQGR